MARKKGKYQNVKVSIMIDSILLEVLKKESEKFGATPNEYIRFTLMEKYHNEVKKLRDLFNANNDNGPLTE